MATRPPVHHLLLLGVAVSLVAHLWMLNGHTPSPAAEVAAVPVAAMVVGPAGSGTLPGGADGADHHFMAVACLAVLVSAAAGWRLPGAWRSATSAAGEVAARLRRSPIPVRLRRPPPQPPPGPVRAGVLLLL